MYNNNRNKRVGFLPAIPAASAIISALGGSGGLATIFGGLMSNPSTAGLLSSVAPQLMNLLPGGTGGALGTVLTQGINAAGSAGLLQQMGASGIPGMPSGGGGMSFEQLLGLVPGVLPSGSGGIPNTNQMPEGLPGFPPGSNLPTLVSSGPTYIETMTKPTGEGGVVGGFASMDWGEPSPGSSLSSDTSSDQFFWSDVQKKEDTKDNTALYLLGIPVVGLLGYAIYKGMK